MQNSFCFIYLSDYSSSSKHPAIIQTLEATAITSALIEAETTTPSFPSSFAHKRIPMLFPFPLTIRSISGFFSTPLLPRDLMEQIRTLFLFEEAFHQKCGTMCGQIRKVADLCHHPFFLLLLPSAYVARTRRN
ncbi:hypothetical protein CEXT_337481 [Caerostris extrusa]|uniref:Uncharacterized protein n=1 Tax=Caerostris extrusa TaxID=172846 RepID=A0AAV4Q8E6_CAEEX|nr:hypothetical protein CEXT_337481 [Caerostris extrusa]